MGEALSQLDWWQIVITVAPVIVTMVVGYFATSKKFEAVLHAIDQTDDIPAALASALADGKLTAEELNVIKLEVEEAIAAIKAIGASE